MVETMGITSFVDCAQFSSCLARYVSADTTIRQPQPIVLDPLMKLPSHCKLVGNYQQGKGKQPWLVVSEKALAEETDKRAVLDKAGVKLIPVKALENGESYWKFAYVCAANTLFHKDDCLLVKYSRHSRQTTSIP